MKEIQVYTDGACSGNPGPGGWGAVLRYKNHEKIISGGEPETAAREKLRKLISGADSELSSFAESNFLTVLKTLKAMKLLTTEQSAGN